MVASMEFRVFWDVALCSHEVDRLCTGVYCIIRAMRQYAPLKRRSTSTWLHSATSQKTLNFKCKVVLGAWLSTQNRVLNAFAFFLNVCLINSTYSIVCQFSGFLQIYDRIESLSHTYSQEYKGDCHLGCCAILSGRYWPTFERWLLPLLSVSTRLQGSTSQMTVISMLAAMRPWNLTKMLSKSIFFRK
jgi:hypothetical protein